MSAPTSRSAASLRSRRSPPKRTAVAMKIATGTSSTTQTITVSTTSSAGSGSPSRTFPYPEIRWPPEARVRVSLPA